SIVIQNIRQLRTQKTEIRFAKRWAVLSLDSSALQPDFTILWNTSSFHRNAYHSSFSIASLRDWTGKSVSSFQSILFLYFGLARSTACQSQSWILLLLADRGQDMNPAITDLENGFIKVTMIVPDLNPM